MRDALTTNPEARQYSRDGHRAKRRTSPRAVRSMRLFYFYVASVWGFVAGAFGFGVALTLSTGEPVVPTIGIILTLLPFAGFALAGGAIASVAYREARHRGSR